MINEHLNETGKGLVSYHSNDNILIGFIPRLLWVQGISFVVLHSKQFMQQIHMLKNSKKPSYIDPLLPNSPRSFQNTPAIRTDLSYFHRLCNNSFRNALFACTIKLFVLLYRLIIVLISHEFLYTINGK